MRFTLDALGVDLPEDQLEEARAFYASRKPGRGPGTLEDLRHARASRGDAAPVEPAPTVTTAPSASGPVPIRILAPKNTPAHGVHLDIHGGGFYMDSAAHNDVRNRALADALDVAVVSVDYRLAPEHPWPAAPDDCEAAALWLIDNAAPLFETSRITIGGFSAGATLAMTTLLRLRNNGAGGAFAGAALQFGTYDLSAHTPAGLKIADEYFIDAYVGGVHDRANPDISPIFGDLQDLPPTLLVVGGHDVLVEDNLAMAARLAAAGNAVDLRIYPESPHGFTGHPTRLAEAAVTGIHSWLRQYSS